jgi:thiamine-monophosphate kinase
MPPRGRREPALREFRLIRDLARRFGRVGPAVRRGIGDDAAVVRPEAGRDLVMTTDLVVEGVHFDPATASWEDIGYKAAAANLSDIAAMGGLPRYALAALALPRGRRAEEVRRLYRGMMAACRPHGVELIGGDTSASPHDLFLSLTVTGVVERGRALTREGARVGDLICVTGTLGDARAGLALLGDARAGGRSSLPARHRRFLIARHLRPTPRLREGRLLARHRLATAAIDLSDGLSGDLAHVCTASGVGALIEAEALPLSAAARAYAETSRTAPPDLALAGGEDYELLFTIPPDRLATLARLAHREGRRCAVVGTIRPRAEGLRVRLAGGAVRRLVPTSYEHFR